MIIVGIGEYTISSDKEEILITHALGSCVALIIHCQRTKRTTLAHIVLPELERKDQIEYLRTKPGYFANQLVPRVLEQYLNIYGSQKGDLQIVLVGGANSRCENDLFRVGCKNVEAIRRILREYQLRPTWMDVGGTFSRTVEVHVGSGEVTIRSQKMVI